MLRFRHLATLGLISLAWSAACAADGSPIETTVDPTGTTSSASGGSGGAASCDDTPCAEACVDLQTDNEHCGACDNACATGESCNAGACGLTCNGGTILCADVCIDPNFDPRHCGGCDNACASGEDCNGGGCCPFGQAFCADACTDVQSSAEHCGACDTPCMGSGMYCISGVCEDIRDSCNAYKLANPSAVDGIYLIDPDGDGGAAAVDMYCDMTTDGGGWSLVLAYAHAGGQNQALVPGTPPTDPINGYSHLALMGMQQLPTFDDVRLYCSTSGHPRVMHFKTSSGATNYFKGITGNAIIYWTAGFVPLTGHAANLPGATTTVFNQTGDDRMTAFPFYGSGGYHWGIRGNGNRWECDDYTNSADNTTLHQVWVR